MKTRIIKRKGTLLSSVAMLSTAMLLTACGGDGGDSPVDDGGANPGESGAQALLYAYPDNGQGEVSTAAPVVLRFSSAVNLGEAQNSITVYEGDAQSGTVVAVTPESVAGEPNNVLLQPDEDLKPNQAYTVVIEDLRLRRGTAKDQTLTFTTRPLHEGPKSLVVKEDTFEVSRRMPDGSDMEPVMDFSSFRFQFTQPIDRATAMYGDGNTVVLRDGAGDPVDATLLIDGAYMTVDPDQEYLNAGETYTLDITAGLASTYGETLGAQSYTLTPKDSSPKGEPAILVQKLTQGTTSRLTGKPVNEVPVNGTLLGENKNITQASAEVVRAELADVTTYTDVTPIRLPKGTVLNGAEISPILIGGEVPAGFGSGDVTMTVLSDASGYLVPNPYAGNNPNALRIVHLLMDVGIATSEARANGAFTQDLLHIELVGLAEVDPTAGVLNLDAVSVVEPNILGQEYGYGMLSFQLQSYKDQNNPPHYAEDNVSPSTQSWVPGGGNQILFEARDPIVINFDEPIDSKSVKGNVSLYENQNAIGFEYTVDGSALIIHASDMFKKSKESEDYKYHVEIDEGISDLSGNKLQAIALDEFEFPLIVETRTQLNDENGAPTNITVPAEKRSPIVLAAYPGFPCALDQASLDLSNAIMGRCQGAFPGWQQGTEVDIKEADDLLPLVELPANKPIFIQFSKEIDRNSVIAGQTFSVERINESGSVLEGVDGDINVESKAISFWPEKPWMEGELYRYTLKSNGDSASPVADCNGGAVCDLDGMPLQTNVFSELDFVPTDPPIGGEVQVRDWLFIQTPIDSESGGPDMVQYFRAGEPSNNVLQILKAAPLVDANANFIHERNKRITGGPSVFSLPGTVLHAYNAEEAGAENQPLDPNADPNLDPNGVLPLPNSAKVLSRDTKGQGPGVPPDVPALNGTNVGCGFESPVPYPSDPSSLYLIPAVCPAQKFTYLSSAITAEVTDHFEENRGLRVLIWPAQIMSTSIPVSVQNSTAPFAIETKSGAQMLRMRFDKSDSGHRTQPIEGWIRDSGDGTPELIATIDLYMDAFELANNIPYNNPAHGLISYPVTMSLSGSISFSDDGRMLVEQYNLNALDIDVGFWNGRGAVLGDMKLRIPAFGSRLQYISSPIK